MIDKMQQHFGFTTMPFGRDLAPGMLHRHAAHDEEAGTGAKIDFAQLAMFTRDQDQKRQP